MQKHKIDRFIQKYNLNGNAEQVRWIFKDDKLSTSFITENQELLGKVSADLWADLEISGTFKKKNLENFDLWSKNIVWFIQNKQALV